MIHLDTIRIGIIDDNEVIRHVIKILLNHHRKPSFEVVLELDSILDLKVINDLQVQPEVILLDVNMPGMTGIEGIPMLLRHFPDCAIIMLTDVEDKDTIMQSIQLGAQGYVKKGANQQELVQVIVNVIEGGSYISPILTRKLFDFIQSKSNQLDNLTDRERQVVGGIVDGLSYKLIAYRYDISIDTVREHIKKIYKKLNINSKGELLAMIKI